MIVSSPPDRRLADYPTPFLSSCVVDSPFRTKPVSTKTSPSARSKPQTRMIAIIRILTANPVPAFGATTKVRCSRRPGRSYCIPKLYFVGRLALCRGASLIHWKFVNTPGAQTSWLPSQNHGSIGALSIGHSLRLTPSSVWPKYLRDRTPVLYPLPPKGACPAPAYLIKPFDGTGFLAQQNSRQSHHLLSARWY